MWCLKITLKTHSDTRWASKYNAVHSLYCQFGGVIKALRDISTNPIFGDGVANAESILKQFDLEFVYFLVMWDKILNQIYRVNKLLQSSNISIDQASKMINCLNVSLPEMRDSGNEQIKTEAISICDKVGIKSELKIKRTIKRKVMSGENSSGEDISADQFLTLEYYKVLDNMMAQMKWRFKQLSNIADDFQFLSAHSLSVTPVEKLKKYAADFAIKYNEDIDHEIINEIEFFKYQVKAILPDLNATALNILNAIKKYELDSTCPNLMTAYRLFLTMPVTVASGERSFSKLKLTKTYLRSTMSQNRLTNSAILSIEHEITKGIDFDDAIEDFASIKSRKI